MLNKELMTYFQPSAIRCLPGEVFKVSAHFFRERWEPNLPSQHTGTQVTGTGTQVTGLEPWGFPASPLLSGPEKIYMPMMAVQIISSVF
jgi:hypothetical protein